MTFGKLLCALALLLPATGLQAKTVTVETTEIHSVGLNGPSPFLLEYREFDPRKGTLQSVNLQFSYTLGVTILAAPNLVGPFATPFPYTGSVLLETSFDSPGSRGFDTVVSSYRSLPVFALGTGGPTSVVSTQVFDVTFDKDDIPGALKSASPRNGSSFVFDGSVDGFLPANPLAPGIPIYTVMSVTPSFSDSRFSTVSVTTFGAMVLSYTYLREYEVPDDGDTGGPTDPTPPELSPVPLPASALLLLGGLGGLAGASRRRRRG